jgi:DNA-binding transcriptional ArsR family regulator
MGTFMGRVRRLPTSEDLNRRKAASVLAAAVHQLPDEVVDQLGGEVRHARTTLLRALRRQARDEDATAWPGGYDMFSRRQMEHIRKQLRQLGPQDRRNDVYGAFLMLIGNIERDTGEITLSRQEFADELGILPRNVSSVMGTLERLGVIRRVREGNRVTYFVNANVAWNGDLDLRKAQAAKSPRPSLRLVKPEAVDP